MTNSRMTNWRRGFTLLELLIVVAVIAILTAVTLPHLHSSQMMAHENAALQEMSSLHKAIASYYVQFNRFPQTLADLGPPVSGEEGPQGANLIPKSLASGHKGGYLFTLVRTTQGFVITAVPEVFG